jgi:glycosyltransferase involved in cell wall biosynthesis
MIEVSLCIPMYRSAAFLAELFGRLRKLDPLPAEIILFDDASPDDSLEMASDFAADPPPGTRVRVLQSERNGGIAAAYNRLALEAQSTWLHILDADDYPLETDFYARIEPELRSDTDVVITSIDTSSTLLGTGNRLFAGLVPARPPRWWPLLGSFATRSGAVYRRERILELPFPEPAYPGSDVIHLLGLHNGRNCSYMRHAHVHYRIHEGATSSQARDYGPYLESLTRLELPTRLVFRIDLAFRRFGQRWGRA